MRDLSLAFVLGSDINYRDLIDLVEVVEGVDWFEVPMSQACHGTHRVDASSVHTCNSGLFVWYDPYTNAFIHARTERDHSRTSHPY